MSVDLDEMEEAENELEGGVGRTGGERHPGDRPHPDCFETTQTISNSSGYVPRMWGRGRAMRRTNSFVICPQIGTGRHHPPTPPRCVSEPLEPVNLPQSAGSGSSPGRASGTVTTTTTSNVDVLGVGDDPAEHFRVNDAAWRSFFRNSQGGRPGSVRPATGEPSRRPRPAGPTSATTPTRSVGASALGLKCLSGASPKPSTGFVEPNDSVLPSAVNRTGIGDQGRLHLTYDDIDETYRAHQPVTVSDEAQATPTGDRRRRARYRRERPRGVYDGGRRPVLLQRSGAVPTVP